jgi:hypothetical protein
MQVLCRLVAARLMIAWVWIRPTWLCFGARHRPYLCSWYSFALVYSVLHLNVPLDASFVMPPSSGPILPIVFTDVLVLSKHLFGFCLSSSWLKRVLELLLYGCCRRNCMLMYAKVCLLAGWSRSLATSICRFYTAGVHTFTGLFVKRWETCVFVLTMWSFTEWIRNLYLNDVEKQHWPMRNQYIILRYKGQLQFLQLKNWQTNQPNIPPIVHSAHGVVIVLLGNYYGIKLFIYLLFIMYTKIIY